MNAAAAGIIQLLVGNPAGATQAHGRGAADYHSQGEYRSASRWARFAELLGGLVEENGSAGKKPKKDGASEDGTAVVYPFFPPGPGKEIARSLLTTPDLEAIPVAGTENATGSATTMPEPAGVADLASLSTTPQMKPAESAPGAAAGMSSAPDSEEFTLPSNPAQNLVVSEPVASGKPLPAIEVPGQAPSAEVAPMKEEEVHTTTDSAQPPLLNQPSAFQTPVGRKENNSTSTVKPDLAPLPAGWLPGGASSNLRRETSQRQKSGGKPTGQNVSEGSSGLMGVDLKPTKLYEDRVIELSAMAATDTGVAPFPPATSDFLGLGVTFSRAPAAHDLVNAAATDLYPGRQPAREAPANLAFGARVVPLEPTEAAAPATGADGWG